MEKEEFLAQYRTKEWYELSKKIKSRDKNTCQMCGRNDVPLSVHHLYYGENGSLFGVNESSLITLCEDCHKAEKEYKEENNSYLSQIRMYLTEFELNHILYDLLFNCVPDALPVELRNNKPTLCYIKEGVFGEDIVKAKNLLSWREKCLKIEQERAKK